jgi:transposase
MTELTSIAERVVRRRVRRDPKARFLPDVSAQLDALLGCPELIVPSGHPARRIQAFVGKLDTAALELRYSSLGRHGHDPKRLLALWLYASTIGIHLASELARACQTDAALRLLAGGYSPSSATLKRFRANNGAFFQSALEQSVRMAQEEGHLVPEEMAVDSMRLRSHASLSAVRRKKRAEDKLKRLHKLDASQLDEQERIVHQQALARNQAVVDKCEQLGVASYVCSNELSALMKFPHGGALPGHRLTVTAAGASQRFVIGVLVDAAPTDVGKLPAAATQALQVLEQAGVPLDAQRQLLADAGYWDAPSLQFAQSIHERMQIWIADARPRSQRKSNGLFDREDFTLSDDQCSVTCPAGRPMQGPESAGKGARRWYGVGCPACPLRPQCTKSERRKFQIQLELQQPRQQMQTRLQTPDAQAFYKKRSAIIEPVFASLESDMHYRRASSRSAQTVVAEVLLKLLAHNVRRLNAAAKRRLCVLWLTLDSEQCWALHPTKNLF